MATLQVLPGNGHALAKSIMNLGTLPNEEPNPLLSHNNKPVVQRGIDIVANGDVAIVSLTGRIDIDSSPAVRDRLLAFVHAPYARTVRIDLSGVTHLDSSGIATLIEALKIAQCYSTEVRLQGLEGRLLRLFQSTGILSLFNESTRANAESGQKVV